MDSTKVFNDPIHSSIQMPLYCQRIIDTPEFQRLRFIKQLGCTCYVFPSAVHTRFEHSIGVSHLAGKLVNAIRQSDRNINIQDNEVACIEIAGLCHDLGHGPFSHAFEDIVPPDENGKKWKHEDQSVVLFEYLIEKNNLKDKLAEYGIYKQEIDFICELILGEARGPDAKLIRENKYYLYQIVNNSVNGVDVDKWDYFARDTHYLGMQVAFNFNRLIPFVKVCDVERERGKGSWKEPFMRKELCFRDKVASDLNHMFLTRRRLHYTSYQHRVSKIISIMLKDAFVASKDHIIFVGSDDKEFNLLESVRDPEAFCQVNDSIVNEIMRSRSKEPGMVKARRIVDRIHRRELYVCVFEVQQANEVLSTLDADEIKRRMVGEDDELMNASLSSIDVKLQLPENIEIEVSFFDYGKGDENQGGEQNRGGSNPLLKIPFYKKSHEGRYRARFLPQDKLPADLPQRLQDVTVRIYTKVPGLERDVIKKAKKSFYERARRKLFRQNYRQPPSTPIKQIIPSSSMVGASPGAMARSPPIGAVSPLTSSDTNHSDAEPGPLDTVIGSGLAYLGADADAAADANPRTLHSREESGEPNTREQSSPEPEASVTPAKRELFPEE